MKIVTSITAQPKQRFNVKLDNNEIVQFYFYYSSSQQAWYYDFEYNEYVNKANKVVLTPNSIRQLKNILPFGFGFFATNNADPFQLESFVNGDCIMVMLNQEDIEAIEESIFNVQ